jgi:hypothetical protein
MITREKKRLSCLSCTFFDENVSLFQMDFGSKYVYKYDLSEEESLSDDDDVMHDLMPIEDAKEKYVSSRLINLDLT